MRLTDRSRTLVYEGGWVRKRPPSGRRIAEKNKILRLPLTERYKRRVPSRADQETLMGDARLSLRGPKIVLAAGAHDALSAKLAEQAGFDAIWASGFGISAVQAGPGAKILPLTATPEAGRPIVGPLHIPVIAGSDHGYGHPR